MKLYVPHHVLDTDFSCEYFINDVLSSLLEAIGAAPSVLLSCGHVVHYSCIVTLIRQVRFTIGILNV